VTPSLLLILSGVLLAMGVLATAYGFGWNAGWQTGVADECNRRMKARIAKQDASEATDE
jgi:hypothetical protein